MRSYKTQKPLTDFAEGVDSVYRTPSSYSNEIDPSDVQYRLNKFISLIVTNTYDSESGNFFHQLQTDLYNYIYGGETENDVYTFQFVEQTKSEGRLYITNEQIEYSYDVLPVKDETVVLDEGVPSFSSAQRSCGRTRNLPGEIFVFSVMNVDEGLKLYVTRTKGEEPDESRIKKLLYSLSLPS